MSSLVAGLDLGSTCLKVVVEDDAGRLRTEARVPTPWRSAAAGGAELDAEALDAAVMQLFHRVARDLAPEERIAGVAVTGMGETGFVVREGRAHSPGIAWFDPRGDEEVASLPAVLREEFPGRTGLPWGVQVTAAKIAWLRSHGCDPAGGRWASLPEWVAARLGCDLRAEPSLIARTGLIDQDSGEPWPELLDWLGVDDTFVPPRLIAGSSFGTVTTAWVPDAFQGAAVTVAGHDHLVAASLSGLQPDTWYVSFGTAEVLLRLLPTPLDFEARTRLGAALINCVPHVVPGQTVLVAGVKTGLQLRRILQLCGIHDAAGREQLDRMVVALDDSPPLADAVVVAGARNDDGELRITVRSDEVTPAALFRAALAHGNDEIERLIAIVDRELPEATATTMSGGWTGMASVVRARSTVLPNLTVSHHPQETASGAAACARRLIEPEDATCTT